MLGAKMMMGLILAFMLLTFLSVIMEGAWLGSSDNQTIRWLTDFSTLGISITTVPVAFVDFFIYGLPNMLAWNYSFLQSSWGSIIRWVLFATISIGVVWTIIQLIVPIIASALTAIGGAITGLYRKL